MFARDNVYKIGDENVCCLLYTSSSSGKLSTSYYAKWWREHNYNTSAWPTDQKTDHTYDIDITDGNQHLLTMMYDGLTVTTYIDGVAAVSYTHLKSLTAAKYSQPSPVGI